MRELFVRGVASACKSACAAERGKVGRREIERERD